MNRISDSELEIMKIIWNENRAMSGTEILKLAKQKFLWEDSTVYTLIRRLTKKKFLIQQKKDIFYYSTSLTEQEYITEQTDRFIDKIYGGDTKNLVAMLCKNQYLKSEDLNYLKDFWNRESGGMSE